MFCFSREEICDRLSQFPDPPNRVGQETISNSIPSPILDVSNLTVYSKLLSQYEVRIQELSGYRLRNDLTKSDGVAECEMQRGLPKLETFMYLALLL